MAYALIGRGPIDVRTELLRYEYGFGFGNLYHPYVEALSTASLRDASALLEEYFFRVQEFVNGLPPWQALPIQAWRYSWPRLEQRLTERIPSTHFGIEVEDVKRKSKERATHLFSLRDSIVERGYLRENNQTIDGVIVQNRAVLVLGGQHRVAVLAHLGWETIPIEIRGRKNTPRFLTPSFLPLVRQGRMPRSEARAILGAVKTGVSRAMAKKWGLPFGGLPSSLN